MDAIRTRKEIVKVTVKAENEKQAIKLAKEQTDKMKPIPNSEKQDTFSKFEVV